MKLLLTTIITLLSCSGFAQKESLSGDTTKPEPFRGGYIGSKVIITKRDFYDTTPNRNLLQKLERILVWKEIVDEECKKKDTAYDNNNVLYIHNGFPCDSLDLEQRLPGKVIKSIEVLSPKNSPLPCCYRPCSWLAIIQTYSDREIKKMKRIDKRNKRRKN